MTKIILFANTDWYLYNFRLPLARRIREHGVDLVLVSPQGPYAEKLEAEGFCWEELPLSRRGLNPIVEWKALVDVWRLYRHERPDLVHHFTIKPILFGSLAARWLNISAVVNSVTGLGFLFVNQGLLTVVLRYLVRPIYWAAMNHSRLKVIFQNEQDQGVLIRMGIVSKGKTVVIPGSGVDITRFEPRPEPAGDPVVLMASRMLWDKGVAEFVEAARLLRQHKPSARFILVGRPDEGNPASIPEHTLRMWHDEGVVEWWGHREDMPQVLASCHVVALPTSYGEGIPKILIEAAAAGKPIVATDVPGCREIVHHGVNGLLVPINDPMALADAIRRFLTDPVLRSTMGRAGREMVIQRFTEEVVNKQTINIYQQLLPKGFG